MRPVRPSVALLTPILIMLGLLLLFPRKQEDRTPARRASGEPPGTEPRDPLLRAPQVLERHAPESEPGPASEVPTAEGAPSLIAESFSRPGTIEGLVLRGGEPAGGGEAWRKRNHYRYDDGWCAHSGPDEGAERTRVGAEGIFRFQVEPGDHCVGVELEGGQRRTRTFHVVEGQPSERWVIALGSSEIRGRVWTEEGLPAPDVSIRFSGFRRNDAGLFEPSGSTRTDLDGSYRITALDPGSYGLEALLGADRSDPLTRHVFATELGPDEVKTVDIGSARELPTWTGRLLTANGTPLARMSMSLQLEERASHTVFLARQESDGTFRIALRPGTYAVELALMTETRELGELVMGEQDQECDYRLRGAWVDVSVRYVGPEEGRQAALAQIMVHASAPSAARGLTACPGYDGHWHLVDVPPGEYEVWASRAILRPGTERFPLLVRDGESHIRLEITFGDR